MKNDGQTEEDNRDSGVLSNPLSFLRSGAFYSDYAGLNDRDYRGHVGNYWFLRSADTTGSNLLSFYGTFLGPQGSYGRGSGFAVR